MSEPKRTRWANGGDRRVYAGTAVLVACLAALAAMLTSGAEARSAQVPANTSPPTISGTAVEGEELNASPGSWTGKPPITFTYTWQRCDTAGASCVAIAGAIDQVVSTYLVTTDDIGKTLRVVVSATNPDVASPVIAVSEPTAVVTEVMNPVNTAEPLISGSPVEGSTLSTSNGTWSGTSITYTYQWVRCGADGGLSDGSNCPTIPGATNSSFTLTADDIGHRLRVQVTADNSAPGSATATANPTDVVQQSTTSGPPRNLVEPSISGTFTVGRILVASIGTWAGKTPLTYAYQWMRCGADGGLPDASNCTTISGATSSTYTLTTDDVGRRMRIRITASNDLGTQTAASNASDAVTATSSTTAPQAPRNSVLPAILGSASVGTTLTASVGLWTGTAPLLYSYQWVRCGADGGQPTGADCPAISGATGTQYTLATVDLGQRLRVQVTARNTLGTATATSNATTQVQAAGSTPAPSPPPTAALPPGAIRLPNGKTSVPVTSVSPPERLVIDDVVFTPNPVRSRQTTLTLRVHVVDTQGRVVRGALVFARSTPLLTSAPGERATGRDGWVTLRMKPSAGFPLADDHNVQFMLRARKPSDELLAGVSNRRLVQVATAG